MDDVDSLSAQKIRIAALWDTLRRYDTYITSVNFKSSLLITLNAAIIGSVIFKSDILSSDNNTLLILLAINLAFISLLSLGSMIWTIKSIWPNVKSASIGKATTSDPSLIFFGSVSNNFNAESYCKKFQETPPSDYEKDLAIQVHEVATITTLKFKNISTASKLTTINLFGLAFFILIKIAQEIGPIICQG